MTWYAAKLIIAWRVEEPAAEPLCEEQIRLIEASSAQEALDAAIEVGKAEEASWENESGAWVTTRFAGLSDLDEILDSDLRSGTEVFSCFHHNTTGETLVADKKHMAAFWLQRNRDKKAGTLLGKHPLRRFGPR
jgi:hypothetical protein